MSRVVTSSLPPAFYSQKGQGTTAISPKKSFCKSLSEKIKDIWKKISALFCSFFCCKKEPGKQALSTSIPATPKKLPVLSFATAKKPVNEPVSILPSDPFKKLPEVLTVKILSYLEAKDVLSFERTSRANRKISNKEIVWKQQIEKNFCPVPCFVQPTKACFSSLSGRRIVYAGLDPIKLKDCQSFFYHEKMTTMRELKKMLAEKMNISSADLTIHKIGMGWKEQNSPPFEGLKNCTMSSRFSHWGLNENDDILCSEALKYYNISSEPVSLNARVNLVFSFRKKNVSKN